jgi:hypothetical protein
MAFGGRRRDPIHSGFRYRGRRAARIEMAFAGKPAGGSGNAHLFRLTHSITSIIALTA